MGTEIAESSCMRLSIKLDIIYNKKSSINQISATADCDIEWKINRLGTSIESARHSRIYESGIFLFVSELFWLCVTQLTGTGFMLRVRHLILNLGRYSIPVQTFENWK